MYIEPEHAIHILEMPNSITVVYTIAMQSLSNKPNFTLNRLFLLSWIYNITKGYSFL